MSLYVGPTLLASPMAFLAVHVNAYVCSLHPHALSVLIDHTHRSVLVHFMPHVELVPPAERRLRSWMAAPGKCL
jgi:hypothetical protein